MAINSLAIQRIFSSFVSEKILNKMEKIVKIGLAVMLFICLLDMPYGYYQFVRVAATLVFVLLAIQSYNLNLNAMVLIYMVLAILFQPFEKIALGREIWNVLDVIVGIGLLLSLGSDASSLNKDKE
jgi:uncharacterized membrane protein YccC